MANFITRGRNIICIGRNYVDHVKELGNTIPKEPFYFLKPTSSYLSHDGSLPLENGKKGSIELPQGVDVHHEVELGVVIGKPGRDIPEDQAMSHVAGYTLAIDVTGRNMQQAVKKKGLPWSAAKGFDTFCPVGPFIPKSAIADPSNVGLWLKIDGQFKQQGATSDLIFPISKLIQHVSSIMTLSEGDLLLTGTPAGVGPMRSGETVEVGMTYPGTEGKVLSQLKWECKDREAGYAFKA